MITQLRPASDRRSSSWILGSATIATVLSMVASSCMPPIAMTAEMNRRDGSQAGYTCRPVSGAVRWHGEGALGPVRSGR